MRMPRLALAPLYLYVALLVFKLYLLVCLVRWSQDRRLQRYFDFAAL